MSENQGSRGLRGIEELELADRLFAALAHPTRRQILISVHIRGEARAGEIAARFDCAWPTTSRHLANLVEIGALEVAKAGRERVYRANSKLIHDFLAQWAGYFTVEENYSAPASDI